MIVNINFDKFMCTFPGATGTVESPYVKPPPAPKPYLFLGHKVGRGIQKLNRSVQLEITQSFGPEDKHYIGVNHTTNVADGCGSIGIFFFVGHTEADVREGLKRLEKLWDDMMAAWTKADKRKRSKETQ